MKIPLLVDLDINITEHKIIKSMKIECIEKNLKMRNEKRIPARNKSTMLFIAFWFNLSFLPQLLHFIKNK